MKPWIFALAVALFLSTVARADMSWEIRTETTLQAGSETRQMPVASQSFAAKANVLRIDSAENPTMFINAANNTVIVVDYPSNAFMLTGFETVVATQTAERATLNSRLPQMEASLGQNQGAESEAKRAMIEAQKKKYELWSRPYSVMPTGERREIDGHPCLKYQGRAGDEVFQEIWVAEDIIPDRSFLVYHAKKLAQFDPQRYSHFSRVKGFPMQVVSHYGQVTVTETVSRYSTAPIPADAFIIPSDFRETDAAFKRNQ